MQRDWNDPHLPDWSSRVRREIARATGPLIVVAHSFGALAAVQAASDYAARITGALLVAPADPDSFGVAEFLPTKPLGFPAIVVASISDPWMSLARAEHWSRLWRAELINLGDAGHINAEAGFGPWPESLALLERLRRAAEFRAAAERLAALSLAHAKPLPRHRLSQQRLLRQRVGGASDRRDIKGAAALLREAGWTVRAPASNAHDAR
jgi:predicted alpha/beta hydrolase family esterase